MTDDQKTQRQPLTFEDDPGSRRSKWIAGALVVALVAWMGSGFIIPSSSGEEASPVTEKADKPIAVAIRPSQAEKVTQYFLAEGQAQPERQTAIRAEASGDIAEVRVDKGASVESGALIARISPARRQADLDRAMEEKARAQRDFDNARTLLERGSGTADRVAATRAALAAAEAAVTEAEEALADTEIRAPFAGRLEALSIDEGEYVQAGAEVGSVLDTQPLTVSVQVPQQTLGQLETGQDAEINFITGETRQGKISFLGANADAETRTFLAEITVPNEDGAIPAGISAEIRIATGETVAHFMSPAILSLGTDGALGVKTVGEGEKVEFHPVQIVRAQTDGVWVSGLPEKVRLITVGQGFVSKGEVVAPKDEDLFGDEPQEVASGDPE